MKLRAKDCTKEEIRQLVAKDHKVPAYAVDVKENGSVTVSGSDGERVVGRWTQNDD